MISLIALLVSSTLPIAVSKLNPISSNPLAKSEASKPASVLVNNDALSVTSGEILNFLPTSSVISLNVVNKSFTVNANLEADSPASFNSLIVSNNCSLDIPILLEMSTLKVSSKANISNITPMLSCIAVVLEPIDVIAVWNFSRSEKLSASFGVLLCASSSGILPKPVAEGPLSVGGEYPTFFHTPSLVYIWFTPPLTLSSPIFGIILNYFYINS